VAVVPHGCGRSLVEDPPADKGNARGGGEIGRRGAKSTGVPPGRGAHVRTWSSRVWMRRNGGRRRRRRGVVSGKPLASVGSAGFSQPLDSVIPRDCGPWIVNRAIPSIGWAENKQHLSLCRPRPKLLPPSLKAFDTFNGTEGVIDWQTARFFFPLRKRIGTWFTSSKLRDVCMHVSNSVLYTTFGVVQKEIVILSYFMPLSSSSSSI
jgi:hypothetical protein